MAKLLRCAEIFPGCEFVARGSDDDAVVALAMRHSQDKHALAEIDWEILAKFCGAIQKDEEKISAA
ncbi:MAG TPA: DUF1059 domain-containing protein [Candidatus Acidoferrales bacterium]|nr:DUF1059 domain-containing protein [Candidatus Acidoferrales bacterium]